MHHVPHLQRVDIAKYGDPSRPDCDRDHTHGAGPHGMAANGMPSAALRAGFGPVWWRIGVAGGVLRPNVRPDRVAESLRLFAGVPSSSTNGRTRSMKKVRDRLRGVPHVDARQLAVLLPRDRHSKAGGGSVTIRSRASHSSNAVRGAVSRSTNMPLPVNAHPTLVHSVPSSPGSLQASVALPVLLLQTRL
jgi:hypothetical protein